MGRFHFEQMLEQAIECDLRASFVVSLLQQGALLQQDAPTYLAETLDQRLCLPPRWADRTSGALMPLARGIVQAQDDFIAQLQDAVTAGRIRPVVFVIPTDGPHAQETCRVVTDDPEVFDWGEPPLPSRQDFSQWLTGLKRESE